MQLSRIVMQLSRKGQTQPEEVNRSAVSDYGHCPYGIAAGKWTLPGLDSIREMDVARTGGS
jgi:hypothetical protein